MLYLILLTILLTPTYAVRFTLLGYPVNFLMVWTGFVLLVAAGYFVKTKQWVPFIDSVLKINKVLLTLIALFYIAGLISLWMGGVNTREYGQFLVLFLEPMLMFFVARYFVRQDPLAKPLIVNTLYVLLAVCGLYAVIQYLTLMGLPPHYWGNSVEPKRAISFFGHPNFYALFSAPLLALLVPDLFSSVKDKGLRIKDFRPWLWVLGALGLALSLSRAGWIGLAVSVGIYLLVAGTKKLRLAALAGVIVIVMVVALTPNLRYRVMLPFKGEKSAVSRFSLWHTGWKAVKESPVTGLGLTGFGTNWNRLNTDPNLDAHNFPHNVFLNFWIETGLLGLLSFLGLCIILIYRGFRKYTVSLRVQPKQSYISGVIPNVMPSADLPVGTTAEGSLNISAQSDNTLHDNTQTNTYNTLKLGIALFIITLIIQGLLDNPYFKNDLAMIFWLVLSLAI
jgi:O-antigen ligase